MPKKIKLNYSPGIKDLCQTPGYALYPLLYPLLVKNLSIREVYKRDMVIWEPASGEGYLSTEMKNRGYTVIESDILTGTDFLDEDLVVPEYDCIVTNPPFSLKYKFLDKCYELRKSFALLMPVDVLGSGAAQKLFNRYGGGVVLMNKRINYKMPNKGWGGSGSDFSSAWFTYKFAFAGEYVDKFKTIFYSFDNLTTDKRKEFEI